MDRPRLQSSAYDKSSTAPGYQFLAESWESVHKSGPRYLGDLQLHLTVRLVALKGSSPLTQSSSCVNRGQRRDTQVRNGHRLTPINRNFFSEKIILAPEEMVSLSRKLTSKGYGPVRLDGRAQSGVFNLAGVQRAVGATHPELTPILFLSYGGDIRVPEWALNKVCKMAQRNELAWSSRSS